MTLLISYDITDNRLRKALADYLLYLGMMRVQKSVFMGYASRTIRSMAEEKAREVIGKSADAQDKIIVMPLHERSLSQARFAGDYGEDFVREITGKIKVRIY